MAERPEDLNLPTAVITRIIKDALPEGVNISKDARLAISKAASVFVLYATSCANNFAMQSKRKTISGQDVLEAMSEMEFERFVEPLKQSLEAYKRDQKGKKEASEKRKQASLKEQAKEGPGDEAESAEVAEEEVQEISDEDEGVGGEEAVMEEEEDDVEEIVGEN